MLLKEDRLQELQSRGARRREREREREREER
jgi:hypothetical protein